MKEFLSQSGRTFTVRLVDEDETAYDELLAMGHRTVPVTAIGETIIKGFDPEALAAALEAHGDGPGEAEPRGRTP